MAIKRCTGVTCLLLAMIISGSLGLGWEYSSKYSSNRRRILQKRETCTNALPCYDVTLTYVAEEQCDWGVSDPVPERFFKHYEKVGLGKEDIIADGREAVQFFKEQTGFDFTELPDDAFIYATATMNNGSVVFGQRAVPLSCNRVLSTAQYRDQSQVFNKLVDATEWSLSFKTDTRVGGSINKVLPAGAFMVVGSYVIESPCKGDKHCKNILFPDDPEKPIFMKFRSLAYFMESYLPGNFGTINCDLFQEDWGWGSARGIVFPTEGKIDALSVNRFPWPSTRGKGGFRVPDE